MLRKFKFIILLLLFAACSSQNAGEAIRIDEVRAEPVNANEQIVEVNRQLYSQLLQTGGAKNKSRLVEVFSRGSDQGFKEYRFFGIQPGSIYELLDLRNVDILVAANGFVVPDQESFWQYLTIIPNQPDVFIEIKRAGRTIVYRYQFKD